MTHAQQSLSCGAEALLQGRWSAGVGNDVIGDSILLQLVRCKPCGVIGTCHRHERHFGSETPRVRCYDTGTADESVALKRSHYESGIFLRHAEWIALDVLIHDKIADDHHLQTAERAQMLLQIIQREAMLYSVVDRLVDRR